MNNSNNFKQPEALRLAEYLETYGPKSNIDRTSVQAAAELRRLYAEVDRLSYQLAYPDNFVKESEQEPVAWAESDEDGEIAWHKELCFSDEPDWLDNPMPLYTRLQAREPLTRTQINQIMADAGWQNSAIRQADLNKVEKAVRAIEAARGIKGDA